MPVRGGYRASYSLPGLELTVHFDTAMRVRRVTGSDGVEVRIRPGDGGFPKSLEATSEGIRLEVVPLTLEPCDDPFMEAP